MDFRKIFISVGKIAIAYISAVIQLLVKANYHEEIVVDEKGNAIGVEFYTTRGDVVVYIPAKGDSPPSDPYPMKTPCGK